MFGGKNKQPESRAGNLCPQQENGTSDLLCEVMLNEEGIYCPIFSNFSPPPSYLISKGLSER